MYLFFFFLPFFFYLFKNILKRRKCICFVCFEAQTVEHGTNNINIMG